MNEPMFAPALTQILLAQHAEATPRRREDKQTEARTSLLTDLP